ncbi:hypothetical protein [Nesterenkonia pannonica]|uniref:hypothetical protein n=1 Tax=Nesterenkonia pannonica TaxID=1548602 RepID=UPI002164009B|nr:hypothetical protein [Nesterenkonia pannonica]
MHQLIHGKRVAVVGPAAASDALGAAIEDYDIVVRTQYKPQTLRGRAGKVGERTDIAYFQTKDLTADWDQLADTIPTSGVKLAVARPLMHTVLSAEGRQAPDWLRFARFEYGLYFRGAPWASSASSTTCCSSPPPRSASSTPTSTPGPAPSPPDTGTRRTPSGATRP